MAVFLPTYVGNFSGGSVSGATGTFSTSVVSSKYSTSGTSGNLLQVGRALQNNAYATFSLVSPDQLWPFIVQNASGSTLLQLTGAGDLQVGSLQTTIGGVTLSAPSSAADSNGGVRGAAITFTNPSSTVTKNTNFIPVSNASTKVDSLGLGFTMADGSSKWWWFNTNNYVTSPSGGTLVDTNLSATLTGTYTFSGAAGANLKIQNAPQFSASTDVPNTAWVYNNFVKTVSDSQTAFKSATNGNRYLEVGFGTQSAYLDFHSLDASVQDYDARIIASGGTAGTNGRATLDYFAATHSFTGTISLTAGNWVMLTSSGGDQVTTAGGYNASSAVQYWVSQAVVNSYTNSFCQEVVGTTAHHILEVHYGTQSYSYLFDAAGSFTCESTYANYGDLAELYKAEKELKPGTFVRITTDDTVDYEIEPAAKGDFLFGVISTAPGLLINSTLKEQAAHAMPVALTGRVPALVVGAVRKGHPISLSHIEGVGEQGSHKPIGFALETNLSKGIKLVEIAIGGRG